jgi:hypothetical protein
MCSLLPFPFIIVPWSSVSYYLESKANQGRSNKRGKLKGFTSSSQLPFVPMPCIIPAHLNVSKMMLYDQRWKALEGVQADGTSLDVQAARSPDLTATCMTEVMSFKQVSRFKSGTRLSNLTAQRR